MIPWPVREFSAGMRKLYIPDSNLIVPRAHDLMIRTRFAPSPTGRLHLGNARTALFSALLAEVQATGGAPAKAVPVTVSRIAPESRVTNRFITRPIRGKVALHDTVTDGRIQCRCAKIICS